MGDDTIKVWHLITRLELGGAQEHTLHVVTNLDRAFFEARLLAGPGGALFDDASYALGSRLEVVQSLQRQLNPKRDALALWWLVRRMRQARRHGSGPQIVHTHSSKAGVLGRAAAAMAGVPVVCHTIHGYGFHQQQSWPVRTFYVRLERLAARATTHFVAVSDADINTGIKEGLFSHRDVTLIRSGFDLRAFTRDERAGQHLRRVLGIPAHAPVAGTVSNFKPQKGPLDFVAAMVRVACQVKGAHFIYAGDGELRAQDERRVHEAGMSGCFHFVGWRRDVVRIMSALDVFVLTSHWEGLPKTVPQAMTVGLPVVATRVGGTPEAVDHGRTGYLVEPGDIKAIASRTAHLLLNSKLARAMGETAGSRVARFDQRIMVQQHHELYQRLLL